MTLEEAIALEKKLHPQATSQDIIKLVIQSCMGANHMIENEANSLAYLKEERKSVICHDEQMQPIGNDYVRVPLSMMQEEDLKLWNHLFVIGANQMKKNEAMAYAFMEKAGYHPLDPSMSLEEMIHQGIHHSKMYAKTYQPHYRVLPKRYVDFFPVYRLINDIIHHQEHACFMIDGCCAAGKSTLADTLAQLFPVLIFHMDDYFLQPHQREKQRLLQPGGNVDYERFDKEILSSIRQKHDIIYQPYDCMSQSLMPEKHVKYQPYIVIEGSYAHHPYFQMDAVKILIHCERHVQLQRIKQRSPYLYERFVKEWIPMEDTYFQTFDIVHHADFIMDTTTF